MPRHEALPLQSPPRKGMEDHHRQASNKCLIMFLFAALFGALQITASMSVEKVGGVQIDEEGFTWVAPTNHAPLQGYSSMKMDRGVQQEREETEEEDEEEEDDGQSKGERDTPAEAAPVQAADQKDDETIVQAAETKVQADENKPAPVISNSKDSNTSYKDRLLEEWNQFEEQAKQQPQEEEAPLPHQKLPDFVPGTYTSKEDVILAAHMSLGKDKLDRLDILHKFWQGPISLGVRITSPQEIEEFFDYYNTISPSITAQWTVHFVLEYRTMSVKPNSFAAQYCHNQLRNLALHSPTTPNFVLPVDLDFVPTFGGYPKLMQLLKDRPELWDKLKSKTLLVLPVLEVVHIPDNLQMNATALVQFSKQEHSDMGDEKYEELKKLPKLKIYQRGVESDLPLSREDLHVLYQLGIAREWHTLNSHAPSNIQEYWSYNPNTTTAASYPIKPTTKYEPYFIGYKPDMPHYWEAFRGFGLNKQSFVRECLLAGFSMEALYELYVTHLAHPSNLNRSIKGINNQEWVNKFQPYLERTYPKPKHLKGNGWYNKPN